jgi:hypothetical protein
MIKIQFLILQLKKSQFFLKFYLIIHNDFYILLINPYKSLIF